MDRSAKRTAEGRAGRVMPPFLPALPLVVHFYIRRPEHGHGPHRLGRGGGRRGLERAAGGKGGGSLTAFFIRRRQGLKVFHICSGHHLPRVGDLQRIQCRAGNPFEKQPHRLVIGKCRLRVSPHCSLFLCSDWRIGDHGDTLPVSAGTDCIESGVSLLPGRLARNRARRCFRPPGEVKCLHDIHSVVAGNDAP